MERLELGVKLSLFHCFSTTIITIVDDSINPKSIIVLFRSTKVCEILYTYKLLINPDHPYILVSVTSNILGTASAKIIELTNGSSTYDPRNF